MYNLFHSHRKKVSKYPYDSEDLYEYTTKLFIDTENRLVMETRSLKNGSFHNSTKSVILLEDTDVIPKVFNGANYVSGLGTACVTLRYKENLLVLRSQNQPHDGVEDVSI